MYPRSGFRSGGTSAKTTLLENHPSVNGWGQSTREQKDEEVWGDTIAEQRAICKVLLLPSKLG